MTINFQRPFVTGAGGASSDDGAPHGGSVGVPFSPYRTRGTIDTNEVRLPNQADVTIAPGELLTAYDVFLVNSAGTPVAGVTGATTLVAGDLLAYVGGDPAVASNWCAITSSNNLTRGHYPNCPAGFVRVVGQRSSASDAV